ncbi:glycine betaine ABC transporter substrate-binding protein [Clostridiaceae bacterium M8S5]|nr:glycine betaine ABC transporter substrate-binding protein [Clostridiaceae bacterium M8S5]
MYKRLCILLIIISLVFLVVSCKSDEKKITVASKPMTEQFIIGHMITQLIERGTDIKVEQKFGIGGGTSNIHPAMVNGEIDIYPEYTGTGWLFVLKEDLIDDTIVIYESVKAKYKKKYDIQWLGLYGFNNEFGLAVKRELAEEYNLKNYSDLAKISDQLIFAAEYDFYERDDGYPNLAKEYDFKFKDKKDVDLGLKYQAIAEGKVDVINVFSTDGRLKENNLVVLEDDKKYFPPYSIATLVRSQTLKKYPQIEKVLKPLEGRINNEEIIHMNYLVEIEKKDPKDVAIEFLKSKGLIQ